MAKDLILVPNLYECPRLVHGFTTRQLGADYDHIAVTLKMLVSQFYYVEQIHSTKVVVVDDHAELARLPQADALVTARKDVVIGVRTADCLPLLVHDPEKCVVAAIHAGFRGLVGGIIQNTIGVMTKAFHCDPQDLLCAFGPCIRVQRYEVGQEVIDSFRQAYGDRFAYRADFGPKPHLDLPGTALMILEDLGVSAENVNDAGLCTHERKDLLYSYRREKNEGRQFNFIGLMS